MGGWRVSGSVQVPFSNVQVVQGTGGAGEVTVTGTVIAEGYVFKPATAVFEAARTPDTWKGATGVNAAGSTAVWTPAAGKSFRLMGFTFAISGNATQAAANPRNFSLVDGAGTTIWRANLFIPGAAGTTMGNDVLHTVTLPANGYLSAAPNTVLNVNLAVALTAGTVSVHAWGTEE